MTVNDLVDAVRKVREINQQINDYTILALPHRVEAIKVVIEELGLAWDVRPARLIEGNIDETHVIVMRGKIFEKYS